VLAKERPETKIVLAEPQDAPLVASGAKQDQNADGTPKSRHSAWKPHPIQGWSPDFIPKLTGDAVAAGFVSKVVPVAGPDAMRASHELATKEGIFVGISSGATFTAALQVAREAEKGSVILAMLPDTGERYLSTPLFAEVLPDMNDEERAILESSEIFKNYTPPPAPAAK
jgi:cysteine synthase A